MLLYLFIGYFIQFDKLVIPDFHLTAAYVIHSLRYARPTASEDQGREIKQLNCIFNQKTYIEFECWKVRSKFE